MRKTLILSFVILSVIFSISLASAEFWACFAKGERIDFCNPKVVDRTCSSSTGCEYCMSSYNETRDCYNQGNWMVCMGIERICSTIGNASVDGEPPALTINNPLQNGLYTSRSVLLDFDVDERADVYYYDNINGRGRWTRVCRNCHDYSRKRSFNEGMNNLTFRAVDSIGNEAFQELIFFVDSKSPRIHKTEPRRGFASGLFEVQYTEDNLEEVVLYYGTEADLRNATLDCSSGKKQWCSIDVNLEDFDGEEIEYWFSVKDVVGNIKESRPRKLDVDTTFPVLNNPENFWNYTEGERYIRFKFNVAEENLDEISYYDNNASRPRWRRFCSRLRNGICEVRKAFNRGSHSIDIQIMDEAGNAISAGRIEVVIDY